jgi:hypothetical protein
MFRMLFFIPSRGRHTQNRNTNSGIFIHDILGNNLLKIRLERKNRQLFRPSCVAAKSVRGDNVTEETMSGKEK